MLKQNFCPWHPAISHVLVFVSFLLPTVGSAAPTSPPVKKHNPLVAPSPPRKPVPTAVKLKLEDPDPEYLSMGLSWTQCPDKDFLEYKVHCGSKANFVPSLKTFLVSTEERDSTEYHEFDLFYGNTYFYKVLTRNKQGGVSVSNTVKFVTAPIPTKPPKPVKLGLLLPTNYNKISLAWTASPDADFGGYELHHSTKPHFAISPKTKVEELSDEKDRTYIYQGVKANSTHYFKLVLFNSNGQSTPSNEIEVRVPSYPPTARRVTLRAGALQISNRLPLYWTRSKDRYFEAYELHASTKPNFMPSWETQFDSFSKATKTATYAQGLSPSTTYYFKIVVVNGAKRPAVSNSVKVTTWPQKPTPPPPLPDLAPVVLSLGAPLTPKSIPLLWTRSTAKAFSHYEVFVSEKPNFDPLFQGEQIASIEKQNTLQFKDDFLRIPATTYYYKVVVHDNFGQEAVSNELKATTAPEP